MPKEVSSPESLTLDELLQNYEKELCGPTVNCKECKENRRIVNALRLSLSLTADRLRTLGRDEDYNEIEESVRKELL